MPVQLGSQVEPIPGYRLIERLGGGGFGEVWKAEAPGGLFKAIKFVYGDLKSTGDGDGRRAEQELKALSRVKSVHHPFILSLERFDIIDGQLIIVMELADRTLHDRFRECRGQGLTGIPREELLNYVEETAEALDLMNTQYQLQHLDIKPQNLFLVYNHVKVADFGLVKDLEGMAATVTGGVTPVYAAPETFDGWVSRYSDQYSLAIVYQELLTGQRPYAGTTMRQLVMQHVQGEPDLSSLSLADRAVVGKALGKNPDLRYPSCLELARALRAAGNATVAPPAPIPENAAAATAAVSSSLEALGSSLFGSDPLSAPLSAPGDMERTRASRGRKRRRKAGEADGTRLRERAGPQPASAQDTPELAPDGDDGQASAAFVPAVIVGLGRTGLQVLRQFRKALYEHRLAPDHLPHLRFLYLDTDRDTAEEATRGEAEEALRTAEVMTLRLRRAGHYLRTREGEAQPPVEAWLNPKVLYQIPRQQKSAKVRALGRLAFVDNYRTLARRLRAELSACCEADALQQVARRTGLDFASRIPRVYIVTGLAGGTGSGMFVDLAYLARHLLAKLGHAPQVTGVLLMPPVKDAATTPGLANTYAALTELNHFARSDAVFTAQYDTGEKRQSLQGFEEVGPAFQRCVLVQAGSDKAERGDSTAVVFSRVGRLLAADLVTSLGRAAEEARARRHSKDEDAGTWFQSFGMYRLFWPRHEVVHRAGLGLSRRLVQHWMTKDARPVAEELGNWVAEQWEALGLRLENLIGRCQEYCEQQLGQMPEKLFADVVGPLGALGSAANKTSDTLNLAPVVQALAQIEKLVGVSEECRAGGMGAAPEPASIEKVLTAIGDALAAEFEDKLAALVVRLIEEPAYRLAGAEEAIRRFGALVDQALTSQETLAKELRERAASLYQRLQALLEKPASGVTPSTPFWKAPFARKNAPPANLGQEVVELLRTYPKCRYQSLVLHQLSRLYVSLRGLLSDELREIGFCRHRLTELLDLLQNPATPPPLNTLKTEKCVLPAGCGSLEQAVGKLQDGVTPEDLLTLDRQVQVLLNRHYRALVQVCMATSTIIKSLAPALTHQAEAFLQNRLEQTHLIDLYTASLGGADDDRDTRMTEDLAAAFVLAAPELNTARASGPGGEGDGEGQELAVISVPGDPPAQPLRDALARVLPHARQVPSRLANEVLVYREVPRLDLACLEQLGPAAREAYSQGGALDAALLHSRIDITDWRAAVAVT